MERFASALLIVTCVTSAGSAGVFVGAAVLSNSDCFTGGIARPNNQPYMICPEPGICGLSGECAVVEYTDPMTYYTYWYCWCFAPGGNPETQFEMCGAFVFKPPTGTRKAKCPENAVCPSAPDTCVEVWIEPNAKLECKCQ